MKVLWLSPIELPAVAVALGKNPGRGGGWIDGLRASLPDDADVTLHVACVSGTRFEPFVDQSVTYHPVYDPLLSTRTGRALRRVSLSERTAGRYEQCRQIVQRVAPDLIHVHGTETALAPAALATGVPTLVSLQGIVSEIVGHYFDGVSVTDVVFDSLNLTSILRGTGLIPGFFSLRRAIPLERRVIRSAHFFTGRTEYDKAFVASMNPNAQYFHCDRVLRPEFYSAGPRCESISPRLLCVGGASPYKGVEVVLRTAGRLVSDGHENLRVRVAGPIEGSPMWPILRRKAIRYGIADRVDWLGRLEPLGLIEELRCCSAFVYASHVDNSPNALAEAMICGAPVVAVAAGGIPSMVSDGTDGLLVAPQDIGGLDATIDRVLRDEHLRVRLSEAARSRAVTRHDPEAVGRATAECYRDILAQHHGSSEAL